MKVKDQLQREIFFKDVPKRIVSLVPSQTELLVDLGLEDQLLGVTKFCVHPSNLRKSKKVVGGTKKVNYDKISALNPDIILCNQEENTLEMVLELEKIAPVHVSNVIRIEDSLELINQYGLLFQVKQKASQLISDLETELTKFKEMELLSRRVAYLIWKDPWMAAGGNTFIDSLLALNGWNNVFGNKNSRYPETDLAEIETFEPEILLLSSEPFPFQTKHILEIQKQFRGRIELVDGEFFSWYGSRLMAALKYFQKLQIKLSNSL
jgi:ABC-type Fe3+-hydroxamate transport system substrate-binding protein